jgi:hypothetical protein
MRATNARHAGDEFLIPNSEFFIYDRDRECGSR